MFTFKLISIVLIFLVTVIAGAYPFIKKIKSPGQLDFPNGEAIAAGVFLGAGLLHMLGDSASDFFRLGYHYPLPFLLAGSVFLLLLWLEHIGTALHKKNNNHSNYFAILAVILLSIHSFLIGAALGLSESLTVATLILIAILAHKWAASFALAVQINKSSMKFSTGIILFSFFSLMVPIGVISGHIIHVRLANYPLLEPIFSALAAGTFLYLGTLHGLKESVLVEKCCNLQQFTYVIVGFAIMAVVAIWT